MKTSAFSRVSASPPIVKPSATYRRNRGDR